MKQQWENAQEAHLARIEQALHWQECAESYDQQIRDYYIARAQHQKHMIRLNQILYGPSISEAMCSRPILAQRIDKSDENAMMIDGIKDIHYQECCDMPLQSQISNMINTNHEITDANIYDNKTVEFAETNPENAFYSRKRQIDSLGTNFRVPKQRRT